MAKQNDRHRPASLAIWVAGLCIIAACAGQPRSQSLSSGGAGHWPVADQPPAGWKRIQVGNAFSFDAPIDTQPIRLQGIDSTVGGYKTDRFNLMFDYGPYSNSLSSTTPWRMVDGHKSRLEMGAGPCRVLPTEQNDLPFAGNVYVELRPSPRRLALTMPGCASSEAALEELQRLYLSLRFNSGAVAR